MLAVLNLQYKCFSHFDENEQLFVRLLAKKEQKKIKGTRKIQSTTIYRAQLEQVRAVISKLVKSRL